MPELPTHTHFDWIAHKEATSPIGYGDDGVPAVIDNALRKVRSIFAKKNDDYANTTWDSNFRDVAAQMHFETPQDAAETLIAVKQARLRSLRVNGTVPRNEGVYDTYLDRATYAVIALALYIQEGDSAATAA